MTVQAKEPDKETPIIVDEEAGIHDIGCQCGCAWET